MPVSVIGRIETWLAVVSLSECLVREGAVENICQFSSVAGKPELSMTESKVSITVCKTGKIAAFIMSLNYGICQYGASVPVCKNACCSLNRA